MAYFRQLEPHLSTMLEMFSREDRWLILINADPDALACALALRRLMIHRVKDVGIAHVNEVSRPDNLAMIRYLRIPTQRLTPNVAVQYDRFALVDSQPHHHPAFEKISFSMVLDHHPTSESNPTIADYKDIKPQYGSCATLLTEYLYNLKIRPGKLLATALLFGIKSDTMSFERQFCDVDVRAFRYLTKFSNHFLLRKIVRSEFRLDWLGYFSQAFRKIRLSGNGLYVFMTQVENPDILVILADFFMRVHEISWTAVASVHDETLVIIFRGDGVSRDVGALASSLFGEIGSAGGHKAMARAEIPVEKLSGKDPEEFVWKKLAKPRRPSQAKKESVEKKGSPAPER